MDEETKIKERLKEVGLNANSIWDLVNTSQPYPEAIPVLISLLKEGISDIRTREGIIRALTVKEARGMCLGDILIAEYYKIPNETTTIEWTEGKTVKTSIIPKDTIRWAIGNTMRALIEPRDIDGVLKIVNDRTNGRTREMFVLALGNIHSEKVEDQLIELLDDDEVAAFALDSLAKLKSTKALDKIKQLTYHPEFLIKKNATKAFEKLSKLK